MQSLNSERVNLILEIVTRWATVRNDIAAAALVGSWARGSARIDSDIDLMFLAANPALLRQDDRWIDEIHLSLADAEVDLWQDRDYGAIWSRHVYLKDKTEIEFSFGSLSWASIDPVDPGTFRVVSDGCRVLYDPQSLLGKLLDIIKAQQHDPNQSKWY